MKITALLFALLCSGCAQHIDRVQSSWYIIETEEAKPPKTYLVLLNRGNTMLKVEKVIINPVRDQFSWFEDPFHGGWEQDVDQLLEPGQVLVTEASKLTRTKNDGITEAWIGCRMPVEVNLKIEFHKRVLTTEHQPALPNSLPFGWETACLLK